MSFCERLKTEASEGSPKACCRRARLFGAMLFAAEFSPEKLRVVTASEPVVKRISDDMKAVFGFRPDLRVTKRKEKDLYIMTVTDAARMSAVYRSFYPAGSEKGGINHMMLQNECDKAAFLRGAFMTGGTVTEPGKSYYFDFTTPSLRLSNETVTFLKELDLAPGAVLRRGVRVIYFRGAEKIESVLKTMGAFNAYFEFVNAKIEKEVNNGLNRTMNCDSGNARRSLEASKSQIKAISALKKGGRLETLPDDLKNLAILRLENEDMSIAELGRQSSPPLSKTAVYLRLKKLEEIASGGSSEKEKK